MHTLLGVISLALVIGSAAPGSEEPQSQPIPFNHQKHAALKLTCSDCHRKTETGEHMTLPNAAKCMACHAAIVKDKPAIKKLAEYAQQRNEIPWVRFYQLPDWVYWSHATHLDAKLECGACHGPVSETAVMTRATNVTTMGGCVDCHRLSKAPTGCESCHEGK